MLWRPPLKKSGDSRSGGSRRGRGWASPNPALMIYGVKKPRHKNFNLSKARSSSCPKGATQARRFWVLGWNNEGRPERAATETQGALSEH